MNSILTKMQKYNLFTFGQQRAAFTKVCFRVNAVVTTDQEEDFNGSDIIKIADHLQGLQSFGFTKFGN